MLKVSNLSNREKDIALSKNIAGWEDALAKVESLHLGDSSVKLPL